MSLIECRTGLEGALRNDTAHRITQAFQGELNQNGMSLILSARQKQFGLNMMTSLSGGSENWKEQAPKPMNINDYLAALNAIRFAELLYRSAGLFVDQPVAPAEVGESNLLFLSVNDHDNEFTRLHPFTAAYADLYSDQIVPEGVAVEQTSHMARLACAAYEVAYFRADTVGPCASQTA